MPVIEKPKDRGPLFGGGRPGGVRARAGAAAAREARAGSPVRLSGAHRRGPGSQVLGGHAEAASAERQRGNLLR